MAIYKREGSPLYWCRFTIRGQQIRRSTGQADKEAAELFEARLRADLLGQSDTQIVFDSPSWEDAVIAWLCAGPRSKSEAYSLKALSYTNRPLAECTPDSFAELLAGKEPATYNRYRAMIVAILRLAGTQVLWPQKKVGEGRLRWLTAAEWERLHSELPPHLKPLAAFSIASGLRQHNATHLTWQQVDMQRKVAWVYPDEAKAGKAISVSLSDQALAILKGQVGKHPTWVFAYAGRGRPRVNGKVVAKPLTKIKLAWYLALERADLGQFEKTKTGKVWVGDVSWHTLRHTWASWHVMGGTPLEVLQKLGGWASLAMVQKYAHLDPGYIKNYANNAKPYEMSDHS